MSWAESDLDRMQARIDELQLRVESLEQVADQARHWLAWFDEPEDAKTWDLNIVAASTRALLRRLDGVTRG